MTPVCQKNVKMILLGELKFTAANLGMNILISRLQRKLLEDPGCMDSCLAEFEIFLAKYPAVQKTDLVRIENL